MPAAERREHPEGDELAGIDLLLDLHDFEMEMDLVGIAVAVEIAAEHHGAFVGAGDRRQLRRQRVALGLAAAAEGLRQREAVELRA